MEPTDVTPEILKGIRKDITEVRDEVHQLGTELRSEITGVRSEIKETNVRLDRLHQRQVDSEVRLATELVNVVSAIHEVRDELRADRELRSRVDDHERRIERLEARV